MPVETHRFSVESQGNTHIIDLTRQVAQLLAAGTITDGVATIFVMGSTAAITTTEFEPGLVKTDFRAILEKLAPEDGPYHHEQTWNDDNGHSHIRASLFGPSLTVPLIDGKLTLGSWQQIVLMDFDTRPRRRELILQVLGSV